MPDLADILIASKKGDLRPGIEAAGKLLETIGKSLQGKSIGKGKLDQEKFDLIRLIREKEIEKLSWGEVLEALKVAGVFFKDAEAVRIFYFRVRNRKTSSGKAASGNSLKSKKKSS